MRATITYLRRPMVTAPFHDSLVKLLIADLDGPRVFEDRIYSISTLYLDQGRNQLTGFFIDLDRKSEIQVWLDDDSVFEPEQLYQLVNLVDPVTRPIVSGQYFAVTQEGVVRPVVLVKGQGPKVATTQWVYPPNALIDDIATIGMGFCAVHRRVLEEWRTAHGPTWFDFDRYPDGTKMLEDSAFCHRMESAGHKIYLHTGLQIGHAKMSVIREKRYREQTALFTLENGCGAKERT